MPDINLNPKDFIHWQHGTHSRATLWVIMDKDGSTVVKDPGLGQPWASTNKRIAEKYARDIGGGATVVDFDTALRRVLTHPKNQPPKLS